MVTIRTLWSDDTITDSDGMPRAHAELMLLLYGDADMWKDQIRPVRAILIPIIIDHLYFWTETMRMDIIH